MPIDLQHMANRSVMGRRQCVSTAHSSTATCEDRVQNSPLRVPGLVCERHITATTTKKVNTHTKSINRVNMCFGVTPSGAQGFFPTLHSEVTPGTLGGPFVEQGIEPGSAAHKASVLPPVLSLWLPCYFFLTTLLTWTWHIMKSACLKHAITIFI